MRLLRLGIRTSHGRPFHPQTQEKVERFHGTMQREMGRELRQPSIARAQEVYEAFRSRYNWERPHEALDMKPPGSVYLASSRVRPSRLPEHELAPGALSRKVDDWGNIGFNARRYKVGRGLAGERVELREKGDGEFAVAFFGYILGPLAEFEV